MTKRKPIKINLNRTSHIGKERNGKNLRKTSVSLQTYVYVFLMLTLCTLKAFEPLFTVDRGESMTHFLFLHHYGAPYYMMICIYVRKDVKDECTCKCCIVV